MDQPAPFTVERRANDNSVIGLITAIHTDVQSLDRKLTTHMTQETHELAQAITDLMNRAFPDGDPVGHRLIHEADIERAKSKAEFWRKMAFEIAKAGLLGFLAWGAIALWKELLSGPR